MTAVLMTNFEPEDADRVLAWINSISRNICDPDDARGILKQVELEISEDDHETSTTETIDNDISEIYLSSRIALRARRHGLREGFPLDLTGATPDGEPWNFNHPHLRGRVVEEYEKHQPEMLIFSPMCGPFGAIHGAKLLKDDTGASC